MRRWWWLCGLWLVIACQKQQEINPDGTPSGSLYFPPLLGDTWESQTPESLQWDTGKLADFYTYLQGKNTRALVILKNGKIVVEKYWGKSIVGTGDFDRSAQWYWASAGKSLTATLVGIAQQDGLLNINDKTSQYLGRWTSAPLEKENLITIRHQLTMTSGLDFGIDDLDCTTPDCLNYKVDAGTQWFYHNGVYTLLEQVVSKAAGISYNLFCDTKVEQFTGMQGTWIKTGSNNIYWSTARDAARFGLLILNKGDWDQTPVLKDKKYFTEMTTTSQDLNRSYGYLWWLNGKNSIVYPGVTFSIPVSLVPSAPADLFAAMGKNGQFIEVIPSLNIVVVRMGEAPDDKPVPISFHQEFWSQLGQIIK